VDENLLNDPRLKAAVKRIWSDDAAPPALRDRVQQILSESASPQTNPRWIGIAIAASLLLGASAATWLWTDNQPAILADEALPQTVAASMVLTHDRCCQARDHHLLRGIHGDDFAAIGRRLSGDLKISVLATPLTSWQFAGAGPCPVWGHESAHLLYRDGPRTLSLFSIPAKDFAMPTDQDRYDATIGTHELAGFIRDGGLYCVVANSPNGQITAAQVQHLRDQLMDGFSAESFSAAPVRPPALAYAGH
jgi:hypothetical protein